MRDVKYRAENLTLYEYRRVEEHLSAMAAKGWRLESVGARLWKYRRAEPARVRYAVTYIPDASQFNPGPTEGQQTLAELCAAAGWEKVTDWFQMQIYCSEAADPIPLETEESVRLEAVHRSMKRNFLPSNILLLLLSLVMLGLFVRTLIVDPLRVLESNGSLFTGPLWLLVSVLLLVALTHYGLWYRRSKRSTAQGGPCADPGDVRWINWVGFAFLIPWTALYLLSYLAQGLPGPVIYFLLHTLIICLIILLLRKITALLRRMKASFGLNLLLTLLADVVLAAVLMGALTFASIRGGWFSTRNGETYTYAQEPWDVSPVDLPLTVSDLTGKGYSHVRRYEYHQGSVLVSRRSCRETVREGEERLWLSYEITKPRARLYPLVLEEALAPSEDEAFGEIVWEAVPAAPWGAEAAYRRSLGGEAVDDWLLVFPDRLVSVSPDWDLTAEQMALAGERLKNA
nr:DUF2812 domain-containing protein [uncultured Oscillibacter sp.]